MVLGRSEGTACRRCCRVQLILNNKICMMSSLEKKSHLFVALNEHHYA